MKSFMQRKQRLGMARAVKLLQEKYDTQSRKKEQQVKKEEKSQMAIKTMREKIQKEKEKLFLNSLLVANKTLEDAVLCGEEVSSGLLSAASSLLKHGLNNVLIEEDIGLGFTSHIKGLVGVDKPKKSGRYKNA